jgi:hypothetical protein
MTPQSPVDQLIEIKTDLLRIQRTVLETLTAVDKLTADLQQPTHAPVEPETEEQRILLYFQRQAARALMEHAASAGAFLPEDALGLTIEGGRPTDDNDVTMWSAIEAPALESPQRRSPRPRNAALAQERAKARAWHISRASKK